MAWWAFRSRKVCLFNHDIRVGWCVPIFCDLREVLDADHSVNFLFLTIMHEDNYRSYQGKNDPDAAKA
jgi:hypothetical protein